MAETSQETSSATGELIFREKERLVGVLYAILVCSKVLNGFSNI